MTFEIALTVGVLAAIFITLTLNLATADFILFLSLSVLIFSGILPIQDAFKGFSNSGVLAVALLFIVSEAIKNAGNLDYWMMRLLGYNRRGRLSFLLAKMMIPLSALSAFINNTPIVVIFTPVIKKWAEKIGLSPSKFLIPLSYATVLGGTCTLIGTSTNLLAHGLLLENGLKGYSLFELAWVGIPCTLTGILYLSFAGKYLLPNRVDVQTDVEKNPKEYVVEMRVLENSPLAGKTIRDAGLRNLKGLYLLDIQRGQNTRGPVSNKEILLAHDRLIFVGVPSAIVELQETPGLAPAAHEMFEKDFAQMSTFFIEAVISSNSPARGKTVKEFDFRTHYGAGVVAVHRSGERVMQKVGSIRLQAGDTLLLFAEASFYDRWKHSQDFYLISHLKERPPISNSKSILTLSITALMILFATIGDHLPHFGLPKITVLHAVIGAALLLFLTKCVSGRDAKRAIGWEVLFVIAFAIGLSKALQTSGTADFVGAFIQGVASHLGPTGILFLVYFITVLTTELLTNNAAVALAFPIALATAHHLNADPRPFVVAVTIAASLGFATPLGYQTHLIVQGPGGYKFSDYVKIGLPLDILLGIVAVTAIRLHWSF